jgi:protein ImuB
MAAAEPQAAEATDLTDPLTALGWWALQFTPKVVVMSGAVLMEVSSSTRLWGGRAALLQHIYTSKKPLALLKYGQGDTSLVALARALQPHKTLLLPDQLPLTSLLAAQPYLGTLARLGCTRWGQLRALPRAGVARRFGAALVDALDQAYGQRPDVYPWLTLPEVFEAALELPHQVENAAALLFGARRLLAQLQVWLQLRQQGVLAVELIWLMDARRNTATQGALVLRTAEASADISHLQRLLAERLGQVTLPAPVLLLRLRSLETQALQGQNASLLLNEQVQGDSLAHLLERLSARLGAHNVLCLQPQADHRPEQMQTWHPAVGDGRAPAAAAGRRLVGENAHKSIASSPFDKRATGQNGFKPPSQMASVPVGWGRALYPTWLLAEPLPLAVVRQQPHYQGPLTLLAGPQRLEAGWWAALPGNGQPARHTSAVPSEASVAATVAAGAPCAGPAVLRDYFVARSSNSPLLWIYRERLASAAPAQPAPVWFLHGVFG